MSDLPKYASVLVASLKVMGYIVMFVITVVMGCVIGLMLTGGGK